MLLNTVIPVMSFRTGFRALVGGLPGPGGVYLVWEGVYLVSGVYLVWGGYLVPGEGGVPGEVLPPPVDRHTLVKT